MLQFLSVRTRSSLLLNIALAALIAAAADGLIFALVPDPAAQNGRHAGYDVPGWLVGSVWIGLFGCLGAARWLLATSPSAVMRSRAKLPAFLLVLCMLYPLYTNGLQSLTFGLAGNVVTGIVAAVVAGLLFRQARAAALLVSLVVLWLAFATFLTVSQLRGAL